MNSQNPTFEFKKKLIQEKAGHQEIEKIQQALKESEERYRSLAIAISEITWHTNRQGEFITEQPLWSAFTGQTFEQYKGWGWIEAIHPEDRQKTALIWNHCLETASLYETEYRVRRHDGEYRYATARGVPVKESDGSIREWVGINFDITERKQEQLALQEALKEAEAARNQLQGIFKDAPAAIAITEGPNHLIKIANPLFLAMFGERPMIGQPMHAVFPELEGQGFLELLDQAYQTGQPCIGKEMVSRLATDNGVVEEKYWNLVYQPLLNSNNQVYGLMSHTIDVTEQVKIRHEIEDKAQQLTRLSQALAQSNKDLEQFAYIASHDLKAPLRGIANLAEWIEEDLAEVLTEETTQQMTLLKGRVQRMDSLINGILQYARAGRTEVVEQLDMGKFISETIELIAPPPQVKITIEGEMPVFQGERIPLQQVFMNLIGNAIKYADKPAVSIKISSQEQGNFYQFSVQDNGPGIEPAYHEKIWGIFQRLESKDQIEGTGIGLSVVKKIIESRGGKIWLDSELGQGSIFHFLWPKSF